MACKKCPHHVRHGRLANDGKTFIYKDLCGLRLKQLNGPDPMLKRGRGKPKVQPVMHRPKVEDEATLNCLHVPFVEGFDYFFCDVYKETFASNGLKNNVVPTKDYNYSENMMAGFSVTELDFF